MEKLGYPPLITFSSHDFLYKCALNIGIDISYEELLLMTRRIIGNSKRVRVYHTAGL